jgi:hypothetical protein
MPEITMNDVPSNLRIGPVGIGEAHDKPRGRAAAILLMKRKLVRAIFLEHPSWDQEKLDGALRLSSRLDRLVNIKQIVHGPQGYDNPVPLHIVAWAAMDGGIPIFLIDYDLKAGSTKVIVRRDAHAARIFEQRTRETNIVGSKAGCLLLLGAMHFRPGMLDDRKPTHTTPADCLGELLNLNYAVCI